VNGLEDLLRPLVPQVLGVLVRRHGDFETCEDAVQEALMAAAAQWPADGVPANPTGWLITVASRRRIETLRAESARRQREHTAAALVPPDPPVVPADDDTLTLLLLCCHPCLDQAAQTALTLRAVAGLSTAEIARALLQPDTAVGQRISRAKQRLRRHGADFRAAAATPLPERLPAVLQVLYFVFNEGYTATSGEVLHRVDLSGEAIRLARQLVRLLPQDGEVKGLLALMLLTDARRPARTRPGGALVPLTEQDRTRWDHALIAEGAALVADALTTAPVGPFQVQAAIAAVHDEAGRAQDTDWPQILGLYDLLHHLTPGPMVALSRSVAVAMVHGPAAGLEQVAAVAPALDGHHRLFAVRAHLHELAGDPAAARDDYGRAARGTLSRPERDYLEARAAALPAG
jgi:RNA polymerase sigma factor (sigma-70 family)